MSSNANANAIDVPGDGCCLFHAIAYPLKISGFTLRTIAASIIAQHPEEKLHGVHLKTWIEWLGCEKNAIYADNLKNGRQWGGALEMTVLASILGINIFVYKRDVMNSNIVRKITHVLPDPTFLPRLKRLQVKINCCLLWVNDSHYMFLELF